MENYLNANLRLKGKFKYDTYIDMTCKNALHKLGYDVSDSGVSNFQKDNNINNTGIINSETLMLLISLAFENDQAQDIITHINSVYLSPNKIKCSPPLILIIMILSFFEIYGVVSLIFDIIKI